MQAVTAEAEWDFIVVGAGSAGCAVAARLAESGRNRVLLLEAGRSDRSPVIQIPAATYLYAIGNRKWDWLYDTEPDPTRVGRREPWPRGKVLGGTSSINGMLYVRGQRQDYDDWAALGNSGWSYRDVLPFFRKAETNENGADEFHGGSGPLRVSNLRVLHPLATAFVNAAVNAGVPHNPDFNGAEQEGVGYLQATQNWGRRCSSARAYLRGLGRSLANLRVETHAHVRRILFDGCRATGVAYERGGQIVEARAGHEVVLSAGAIGSPHILMLSGLGPAAQLQKFGLVPIADRPAVGQNLQEHAGAWPVYAVRERTYNVQTGPFWTPVCGFLWLFFGRGPASTPDAQVLAFVRTSPDLDRPDVQFHFTPAAFEMREDGPYLYDRPAVSGLVNVCRPKSRGEIVLRSADPHEAPSIQPNLLSDRDDVERLIAGSRLTRKIYGTEPLSASVVEELSPGPTVQTDDEWEDHLRRTVTGIYHPAGTCRMGPDDGAVVDARLRVRGVAGLRVADASIMPTLVSGNTNAPAIMIGEKAAAMILEDNGQTTAA